MMRKVQEAAMKKFGLFAQIGDTFGTVGAIVATMDAPCVFLPWPVSGRQSDWGFWHNGKGCSSLLCCLSLPE